MRTCTPKEQLLAALKLEAPPDGLQSIEPVGSTSLTAMKRQYGRQFCLLGNVDCSALVTGPPERIEALTRQAMREGSPGGGYVLMSSNAIHAGVPWEHYRVMNETWKKFGTVSGKP